ncbi:hypothetical protein COBT_000576 [Conglomerata obtusa]
MTKDRVFNVLKISGVCLFFVLCIVMCSLPKNINEDLNRISKENKLYRKNTNDIDDNIATFNCNQQHVSQLSKTIHMNSLGSNQGNSLNFQKKMHSSSNAYPKLVKVPSLNIPNRVMKAESSEYEKFMPQSVIHKSKINDNNSFEKIIDQKPIVFRSDGNYCAKMDSNRNKSGLDHLIEDIKLFDNCDESTKTSANLETKKRPIHNTNENKTENISADFPLIDQKIVEKIPKKQKNKKKQVEIFNGTNIDLEKRDELLKAGFDITFDKKKRKFIDKCKTNARFVGMFARSAFKGKSKNFDVPLNAFDKANLISIEDQNVTQNDCYNKDDCEDSFCCRCTKKFVFFESQHILITDLYDHYQKINTPNKKFIIIYVVQGYYTEITVELCNREHPEYLKTTLSNVLKVKECKYHNQFSLHLNHIVNNVTNYFKYVSEIQKSCNRKMLVYVHENKTNDFCKKFDINVKYSCIYIGNDTDVYMSFLVEHFANTKQILDYGKGKKYKYKHLLDENSVQE